MQQQSFDSADKYILCATDTRARIGRMKQVIAALEAKAITAAITGQFDEYSLDDGQTKIRTKYRSMDDITAGLMSMNNLLNTLVAQYNNDRNGRITKLVDGKNFNG